MICSIRIVISVTFCWLLFPAAGVAAAPALPDDLKLVPADAFAFVSLRGAELTKTDLVKRIRKELGTDGELGRELTKLGGAPGYESFVRGIINPNSGGFGDLNLLDNIDRMTTFFRIAIGKDPPSAITRPYSRRTSLTSRDRVSRAS